MKADYVKEYFKNDGTVSTWWEPEQGDKTHIFAHQTDILTQWLIGEEGNALDVAAGKGRITRILRDIGCDTISLDLSRDMLNIGISRGCINLPLIGDAERLVFDDESFRVVTCMDALVHFPNPQLAVQEAYRVLEPKGMYLVNTSNPYEFAAFPRKVSRFVRKIFGKCAEEKGEGIFSYIPPFILEQILEESGFSIEEKRMLGFFAPIEVRDLSGKDFYLLSPNASRRLENLGRLFERMSILNKFCITAMYKARK